MRLNITDTNYKQQVGTIIYNGTIQTSNIFDKLIFPGETRILSLFKHAHVLSKLTGRLPRQATKVTVGTNYNPPTQPLPTLYIIGTIIVYPTQPLISTKLSTSSEIRVFLRYRAIKAISALKSPILQVIFRFLESVATNTHFSVNPHAYSNCRIRRTLPNPDKNEVTYNLRYIDLSKTNNYNEE